MVKIAHMMPGRLRLRFEPLKGRPEFATKLHNHLSGVSGLGRFEVNARTGSVLLFYNTRALGSAEFLDAISMALGKLFPAHFAPGRLRVRFTRGFGTRAIEAFMPDQV
jgi:hypothetical protein